MTLSGVQTAGVGGPSLTSEEERAAANCGASSSQTPRITADRTIESMCRPLTTQQPQRPSPNTARAAHSMRLRTFLPVAKRQDCSVPITAISELTIDCGHLLMLMQRTPHKSK